MSSSFCNQGAFARTTSGCGCRLVFDYGNYLFVPRIRYTVNPDTNNEAPMHQPHFPLLLASGVGLTQQSIHVFVG